VDKQSVEDEIDMLLKKFHGLQDNQQRKSLSSLAAKLLI
jgi:hypothetical protein